MRQYELLIIVRPTLDSNAVVEVSEAAAEQIKTLGGEVKTTKVWGKRKLTFPIKKQSEGTYVLFKFDSDPAALKDLDFNLKLNENILRFMIVLDETVGQAEEARTELVETSAPIGSDEESFDDDETDDSDDENDD